MPWFPISWSSVLSLTQARLPRFACRVVSSSSISARVALQSTRALETLRARLRVFVTGFPSWTILLARVVCKHTLPRSPRVLGNCLHSAPTLSSNASTSVIFLRAIVRTLRVSARRRTFRTSTTARHVILQMGIRVRPSWLTILPSETRASIKDTLQLPQASTQYLHLP